jgi:hypothetical protein
MQQATGTTNNIAWIVLVLSAFYSYLLVNSSSFPYLGLFISLASLTGVIYFFKKHKNLSVHLLAASAITLTTFIFARSNILLIFIDLVLIIYLLSLLITYTAKRKWTLVSVFMTPLHAFIAVLNTKSIFEIDKSSFRSIDFSKISLTKTLASTGITALLLIVIIPLLSSTNPIFKDFITWILSLLDISEYVVDFLLRVIKNLIVWWAFYTLMAKTVSHLLSDKLIENIKIENSLKEYLSVPKIVVGLVLLAFFVSQIKLYNLSGNELASLGYSHSNYTREIFGQLSIVASIIFFLLYNSKHSRIWEKITNYFLIVEGIFLTIIAQKSVSDYIQTWGFTIKRLYGLTGVIWLFAVFFILLLYFFLKKSRSFLVRGMFSITTALVLIINFVNFDYVIYHYGKSTTHVGTDYGYLADLSYDSEGHAELLDELSKMCLSDDILSRDYLLFDLEALERKYQSLDVRTFNLAEYKTYLKIANKLEYYRSIPYSASCVTEVEDINETLSVTSIDIDSRSSWKSTSIQLKKGQKVSIETAGTWTADVRKAPADENTNNRLFGYVGPEGNVDLENWYLCYQNINKQMCAPRMALLGQVDGQVFLIGSNPEFTSPADGYLYLTANDDMKSFGDNSGIINVTIQTSQL